MTQTADDYFDAANVCELDSRWSEANDNYSRAIELRPDFVEAYDNRAANWVELGEYGPAIADYHKVLEFWPDYAEAHNNLTSIYLDAESQNFANPQLALSHAGVACRLTGNDRYELLATCARTFHACREYAKAVYYQQLAIEVALQDHAHGHDRLVQINAEVMLPELEHELENYRADARVHRVKSKTLIGRLLSLVKPSNGYADKTKR